MSTKRKLSILVVDDEEVIRSLFDRVLKTQGYEVETAESGERALSAIKKEPFDVVFLDIKLPGIDGVETLRKIKKINPKIKAFMMTAYTMEEKIKEALELGAISCLNKPLQIKTIVDALKEIEKIEDCPRLRKKAKAFNPESNLSSQF